MQTTKRLSRRALATVTCAALIGGSGFGASRVATASVALPAVIENATRPALATAPAKRLMIDPTKPIFPMKTKPRCDILDNFGDPRSGGRIHDGTDILATLGQEVYAVVDGTLTRQTVNDTSGSTLSGNMWRLVVAGGTTWYAYAHLSAFAAGLSVGAVVKQGELIGYVGDTGNPGPGNYHLHFEAHPNDGAAINALRVLTIPPDCSVTR